MTRQRRCPRCGVTHPRDSDHFYIRPSSGRYEYCRGEATNDCHKQYWSRKSEKPSPSKPRFGVEIEFVGSRYAVAEAMRSSGLMCLSEMYSSKTSRHWRVIPDNSVPGGGELVSPTLTEARVPEIVVACLALERAGSKVDARCGLHVHVEVKGVRATDQIERIYEAWFVHQPIIETLLSPSRRANRYCRPLRREDLDLLSGAQSRAGTMIRLQALGKYKSLSGRSLSKRGTLEVRSHQGTTRSQRILPWVQFCRSLFSWAISGTVVAHDDLPSLLATLSEHGLDAATAAALMSTAGMIAASAGVT